MSTHARDRVKTAGVTAAAISLATVAAIACGEVLSGGEDEPAPTGSDGGADATAESAPPADGSAGDGEPSCDDVTEETFAVEADTVLYDQGCDGANHSGDMKFINILPASRALLRFVVSDEAMSAILAGRVTSMTMQLTRETKCDGLQDGCPDAGGVGLAQELPVRTDWDEGTAGTYLGADRCRRLRLPNGTRIGWGPGTALAGPDTAISGADWGAPGKKSSIGGDAGTSTIDIDPAGFNATNVNVVEKKIAVMVVPDPGRMIFVTKEGSPAQSARLAVAYCQK